EDSSSDNFNQAENGQVSVSADSSVESASGGEPQDRDRGGWRGRRRRRGGRRDGRGEGRDRGSDSRPARPSAEATSSSAAAAPARAQATGRSQQFGPPAGYQPILLPGESISKYRGLAQPPIVQEQVQEQVQDRRAAD